MNSPQAQFHFHRCRTNFPVRMNRSGSDTACIHPKRNNGLRAERVSEKTDV